MRGCIVQARLAQVKPLPPSLNVSLRVSEPKRVYDLSTFIQVRDLTCGAKRYRDTAQVYEHVALSSSPGGVTRLHTLQTQSGPLYSALPVGSGLRERAAELRPHRPPRRRARRDGGSSDTRSSRLGSGRAGLSGLRGFSQIPPHAVAFPPHHPRHARRDEFVRYRPLPSFSIAMPYLCRYV